MGRDMFGDVVKPSIKVGSRSWYTVPLSVAAHTVLLAAIVIIPLMAADVLPTPPSMMAFVAAPPPPPPPPPPENPPPPNPEPLEVRGAELIALPARLERRSEERRVGKECRSRWSPYH